MSDEELAAHGIEIQMTPRGIYFVSVRGWGRRIGPDAHEARTYAENLVRQGLRSP